MKNEASKEWPRMKNNNDDDKKQIQTRDDTNEMEQFETKDISGLGKKQTPCLFTEKVEITKPFLIKCRICLFCEFSLTSPGTSKPLQYGISNSTMSLPIYGRLAILPYFITVLMLTSWAFQKALKKLYLRANPVNMRI